MSLKARRRLLDTLIDGALAGLPRQDINAIAELLIKRGASLVADEFEFDPDLAILLHPAHPTTQILNAINEHLEATGEDNETLVTRVINCLGSQAAAASQPN